MHALAALISFFLLGQVALGAPASSLDADAFLQNGKDAQALNAKFVTLKASDSCHDGEMACVKDSIAHCANTTWELDACPKTLSCFALPSVREKGTVISCTSNVTALSVINASGATGGIAANGTEESVSLPVDCDGNDESDDGNSLNNSSSVSESITRSRKSSHTASASSSESSPSITSSLRESETTNSQVTVTTTVIPTATLPSETFTLNASEAASLLSSLARESGVIISTVRPSTVPTASASASNTTTENHVSNTVASSVTSSPSSSVPAINAPTTITLLGFKATSTPESPSATATANSGDGYDY